MLKVIYLAASMAFESVLSIVVTIMILFLGFFLVSGNYTFSLERIIQQYTLIDYRFWLIGFAFVGIIYLINDIFSRKKTV